MRATTGLLVTALLTTGCGSEPEKPAASTPPLARPEPTEVATPAMPVPPDEVDTSLLETFCNATSQELDELQRRHGELSLLATEYPAATPLVTPLLDDIESALTEARVELDGIVDAEPGALLPIQARFTSQLGDIASMLENAAAVIEEARSAPAILPDIGEPPPPPKVPK